VTLTPHSFLVPRSRKSRAIPLLALWAVRPVHSASVPVQGCTLPYRYHFTIDVKKCGGNTANRSGDEICGLTLSKGGDSNNTRNIRKVAYIYMAISILAVACRVHWKYSMFARHGTHKMAGCDVTSRDNRLVTSRTNQSLP